MSEPKKYMVITHKPRRQGVLGYIPELFEVEFVESDNPEMLVDGIHVPANGSVYIVEMNDVTTVTAKLVRETKGKLG